MARKKKRGYGDGSVHKRSDGRCQGQFTDELTGKRHTVYAPTEEECWQKIDAKRAELAKLGTIAPDRITVSEWAAEWLNDLKKINYRAKSYQHRSGVIANWIDPLLGSIQLQKLNARQIQKLFVAKMVEAGLAPNTILAYYGVVHTLLDDAHKREMIAKNPCEHIVLPEVKEAERPVLTMEQIDLFLAELEGIWLAPMVELAVYTAMREGELCALRWQDIDFEAGSIMIRSTVSWVTGHGFVVGPPKTESSAGRIAIPQCASNLLLDHRTRQKEQRLANGPGWNPLGLVFPHENGGYRGNWTICRHIKRVAALLGLPDNFTFHCLRHTAVALLIKAGAHPKMIQEICRHKSIETTMDLYGHLFEGMHREAMNLLDRAFEKARRQKEA
jgi:integrase